MPESLFFKLIKPFYSRAIMLCRPLYAARAGVAGILKASIPTDFLLFSHLWLE